MSLDPASLQIVRQTPLFAGLTDDQLGCIAGGEIIDLPTGAILAREGDPSIYFFVTLEGELRITRNYDKQEILMAVNRPGVFMGELAFLLETPWLATVRASKPSRLFRLDANGFWKMLSECHSVARQVFRLAAMRVRNIEGYSQKREKLISLGTMAAGLAHELNNPASAARRATAHLRTSVDDVQSLLCQLSKVLDADQWTALVNAVQDALEHLATAPALESLARSDREEAVTAWLDQHGIAEGWKLSEAFVRAQIDGPWLEKLVAQLPPEAHSIALSWLEARITLKSLLGEVENSTTRIAELVKAIKSYSYMDQSPMQEIDIHEGLESTLTMMCHKLKGVTLSREYDCTLPKIMAYGSELNQVWTNLIDNAIFAVNGTGRICIGTYRDHEHIVVEIVDNGAGIPKDVQARLFEPFFTTKGVGSGTGLGLVISNRIIADRHAGEIEVESKPGDTRFKVRLPINRQETSPTT
jgi:signal transduction histidine kinase